MKGLSFRLRGVALGLALAAVLTVGTSALAAEPTYDDPKATVPAVAEVAGTVGEKDPAVVAGDGSSVLVQDVATDAPAEDATKEAVQPGEATAGEGPAPDQPAVQPAAPAADAEKDAPDAGEDHPATPETPANSEDSDTTAEPEPTAEKDGWVLEDGTWRYYADGTPTLGWLDWQGHRYHFDPMTGAMTTGWYEEEGIRHYLYASGVLAQGDWVQSAEERLYLDDAGTPGNGWVKTGSETNYVESGVAHTGALAVDGKSYWFNQYGNMAHDTTVDHDAGTYYYQSDGAMLVEHELWQADDLYYFGSDGRMLKSTRGTIGGKMWAFDDLGRCYKRGYVVPEGWAQVSRYSVELADKYKSYGYVMPCRIGLDATREECIEMLIKVAYEYKAAGSWWVDNTCNAPGQSIDCSGLVMEGLYACGMSLEDRPAGPYNPWTKHYVNGHFVNTWRANRVFQPITASQLERGDIVYYRGHVAIYLGNGKIINSTPEGSENIPIMNYDRWPILGYARVFPKM